MSGIMWENQYRMTTVCIDDYENGVMSGRLYNPYLPEGDSFHSTMEFLKKMESMLDGMISTLYSGMEIKLSSTVVSPNTIS